MRSNPRRIIPIILLIAIAGGAIWYFTQRQNGGAAGPLTASGTIETTQVNVASELGGHVAEVLVQEGDPVSAGQELVRLDDALLKAQLSQAQASLQMAQANYALAAKGPTDEQRQLAIASAEQELTNAQQALQALHDNASLSEAHAVQNIASIDKARDKAQQALDNIVTTADPVDVESAWASLILAQDKLEKAQEDFEPYQNKDQSNVTRAAFLARVTAAQKQYDNTVERYNNLVGTANQYDLALTRANVTLADAQLADAQRQHAKLQEGIDPDALALAQARVSTAEANLTVAKANPSPEQLAVAQAQVEVAQGALAVIEAQVAKLVVRAPVDGVVLTRSTEPGEVVMAGATLLALGRLDNLKITVYVPENRYGEVNLGEVARVTVDTFPAETFEAKVTRIADQAEFTPRNVQTEEGRSTTVYAVELAVINPEGKLKPGMPADVAFGQQ